MATKEQRYAQATERVACQVTDSFEDWTEFLKMAGRLYKYPFDQQLLIYAQRPDAVACAEADLWEQRMKRRIRDGSQSIAVVDNSGTTPVLRYLFDVSDTEGVRGFGNTARSITARFRRRWKSASGVPEKTIWRQGWTKSRSVSRRSSGTTIGRTFSTPFPAVFWTASMSSTWKRPSAAPRPSAWLTR